MDDLSKHRIARRPEVVEVTGLSAATIYRLISKKLFPAPIRLGPNSVGWLASEVQEWIRTRQRAMVPEDTREA